MRTVRYKQWTGTSRAAALLALTASLTASTWVIGSLDAFADRGGTFDRAHLLTDNAIFDGAQLEHATGDGGEKLTQPDDIT
jgi:hypothetical protein